MTRSAPKVRPFEERLKRLDDADISLLAQQGNHQLWRVQAKGSKDHHDIGVQHTAYNFIIGDCDCDASKYLNDPEGCVHRARLLTHLKETETVTSTTEMTRSNGAIAQADLPSYEVMEKVLGTGDLGSLTPQQRVEYYVNLCQSVGLNPMSRPFEFITFQGKVVPYAKKDATDQLRKIHNVSIQLVEKKLEDGVYTVTAKALLPSGRSDESTGVVAIGNAVGDARANSYMRAESKAKRRVTLSICGLGFLDESEVDTVPGMQRVRFDANSGEIDTPVQRPVNQVREAVDVSDADAKKIVKELNDYINAAIAAMDTDTRTTWHQWISAKFDGRTYKKLSIEQLATLKQALVDATQAAQSAEAAAVGIDANADDGVAQDANEEGDPFGDS